MILRVAIPAKCRDVLSQNVRYKVLYGGRGSAKSWSVARYLVCKASCQKLRILCAREMQNSIRDSVHRLLTDQIYALGLQRRFIIGKDTIRSLSGAEFIFRGMRMNLSEVKSMEGLDIIWCEEAERFSEESWVTLVPTLRKAGSEFLVTFNPESVDSPAYVRFVEKDGKPANLPNCVSSLVNYVDNPRFPDVLQREMEYDQRTDKEKYEHVWLGKVKKYANAVIFKDKIVVQDFPDPPTGTQFYYGMDFGFSVDPTCVVALFIVERILYVWREFYGHGVEIVELEAAVRSVPGTKTWTIRADSQRPDTISFLSQKGFNMMAAEKGKGSVEDGLEFLRSFEKIVIHPSCKGSIDDFSNYRWKVDKITGEILPIPLDTSNHSPDACRYALEPYIKSKKSFYEILD